MAECKEIDSDSFKDDIAYKLFTYKSYLNLFKCMQVSDWCWIVAVT